MGFFFNSLLNRGFLILLEPIIVKEQSTSLEALLIVMDSIASNYWIMYWESMSRLVAPGGVLVITSCNNTRDELVQEVEEFNQRKIGEMEEIKGLFWQENHRAFFISTAPVIL
ncbi:hypothetical protein LXL04_015611 [Taraxacum kok-saghyz]